MNGFHIIDRKLKPTTHNPDYLAAQQRERMTQAHIWADMRIGNREDLISSFFKKIEDIRRLDTLSHKISNHTDQVCTDIRLQHALDLHNRKSLDLDRIIELL
jgi:hypothetical protein